MSRNQDFSDYVGARWSRLVRAAVLLGCTPTEAEDVVQTTLLRCLRHWGRVQRATDRDAYIHRALINTFTSARRRRWTHEHPTEELPESPKGAGLNAYDDIDAADAIVRSLQRLTPDQRTVVVLRYYSHLTEQQMATVLRIPAGTIKSRLSRALKVLAEDPHLAELRGTP